MFADPFARLPAMYLFTFSSSSSSSSSSRLPNYLCVHAWLIWRF